MATGGGGGGKRICNYYARTGKCAYGDGCKFSHVLHEDLRSTSTRGLYAHADSKTRRWTTPPVPIDHDFLPLDKWDLQYLRARRSGRLSEIKQHCGKLKIDVCTQPNTGLNLYGTAQEVTKARAAVDKILRERHILEVKVPEGVGVGAIKKEGYKALHDCQNETGGMVVFIPQDRVLKIFAEDIEKCKRAQEWMEVHVFVIKATEPKYKFFETHAGPDTWITFEPVPLDVQQSLLMPQQRGDRRNNHYMVLSQESQSPKKESLKTSIYHKDNIKSIKEKLLDMFWGVEPQQEQYKMGIEARFGRVVWDLPEDVMAQKDWRLGDFQENATPYGAYIHSLFYTAVTGSIDTVLEICDKPTTPINHVDVNLLLRESKKECRLVIEEDSPGNFNLLNVFHPTHKGPKFDLICLGKSHDIRIAPNYAPTMDPHCDMDEFQIAEQFTKTLKKGPDGKLQMVAKTDQYLVRFLREKTQTQYPVIETRWIVAVYDVKEFRMHDGLGQCDINSVIPIPFQNSKTEIELWNQKAFGDFATRAQFTMDHYCKMKSTTDLEMAGVSVKASRWTAEEMMSDFDEFIDAAIDIAELLGQ